MKFKIKWLYYLIALLLVIETGLPPLCGNRTHDDKFVIARIHYRGGGDWYSDPTSLTNLLDAVSKKTNIKTGTTEVVLQVNDSNLYSYPFIYVTGHGNIRFTNEEIKRLRNFLTSGGFLWADDNYGMDKYFRREMKRLFPDSPLTELPFSHPIYHCYYDFPNGLPKIHEHHGGPPHGYGIFHEGRLVVFYSFNTDLGDGLESAHVHNDPPEKREAAIRMAINIVVYALTH